jgi:acyl-CoA thioesterase YciA
MPSDVNQYGDIFGGWLLAQMDIAGGLFASQIAGGRTATVAVDAMTFRKPVYVGDVMCIYADLLAVGSTSINVHVEAWVLRRNALPHILVTEGKFVYVALGDDRRPRPVVWGAPARRSPAGRRKPIVRVGAGASATHHPLNRCRGGRLCRLLRGLCHGFAEAVSGFSKGSGGL